MFCEFVEEIKFHQARSVHLLAGRRNLRHMILGDPIPNEVKEERRARIMELQQRISEERNESLVGTVARVLIDRREGEFSVGRTEWDAPEIDQEVFVHSEMNVKVGSFVESKIMHSYGI